MKPILKVPTKTISTPSIACKTLGNLCFEPRESTSQRLDDKPRTELVQKIHHIGRQMNNVSASTLMPLALSSPIHQHFGMRATREIFFFLKMKWKLRSKPWRKNERQANDKKKPSKPIMLMLAENKLKKKKQKLLLAQNS